MTNLFTYRNRKVISLSDRAAAQSLVDAVLDGHLVNEVVYRDNWRTLAACIRFSDSLLILKIPRARNLRMWERCLSVFRGSDALRSFKHLQLMNEIGFAAPEPVLACEKRDAGFVTDSFLCYHYAEGQRAGTADAPKILDALRALHQKGYLRTDAQLANFLVQDDTVIFIDFRLKKPWLFSELKKAREIARFLRSCPEARRLLTTSEVSSFWFRLAHRLEEFSVARRNFKRLIRNRKKID